MLESVKKCGEGWKNKRGFVPMAQKVETMRGQNPKTYQN